MAEAELIDPMLVAPDPVHGKQGGTFAASSVVRASADLGEVSVAKERYASWIALIIACTFALCTGLLLVSVLLIALIRPGQAEQLIDKAFLPALTQVGTFLTSTFGSLLAFVLGYYFKEKNSSD